MGWSVGKSFVWANICIVENVLWMVNLRTWEFFVTCELVVGEYVWRVCSFGTLCKIWDVEKFWYVQNFGRAKVLAGANLGRAKILARAKTHVMLRYHASGALGLFSTRRNFPRGMIFSFVF